MKKFRLTRVVGMVLFLGWMVIPAVAADPVTAEQIVSRCADALGGADKIGAVKTLRFKVTYPGIKMPQITEIKRPNRIRSEADSILVFNGKRAGFLKGAPSTDGRDPGPQLVESDNWKDFEVDIAFLFPAFFDYPAEYIGLETVDGKEFHKLGVNLPMGIRVTYFVDAKTFLTQKIVADVPYQGVVYHPERVVSGYENREGMLFPQTFTSVNWGAKGRATVASVEVNVPLGDDRFEMP